VAKLSLINDRELTTMRKSLVRLALAGAAVTALAAGAAVAQIPAPPAPPAPPEAPQPPPPPEPPPGLMGMGPDAMFMHHARAFDPEKRAQRLRDVLQLRPDQDRALKAYVEATSPKIVKIKKEEAKDGDKTAERGPPTTLERLDRMSKAADALKARAEATRAFYLALTPSQQKTFDVLDLDDSGPGGERIHIHRLDTRGPDVFKGGEHKVIIQQRKVG
jgi:hypothetical protein